MQMWHVLMWTDLLIPGGAALDPAGQPIGG